MLPDTVIIGGQVGTSDKNLGGELQSASPGLSLIPEWLSDKPLVGAPVASSGALSKFHSVFNIFITTYWQVAVRTHFSYVYIHITHTIACSNKYL